MSEDTTRRNYCKVYEDKDLHIRLLPNYMSNEESLQLYEFLLKNMNFERPLFTKTGGLSKKRNIALYGSKPYYNVTYKDVMTSRPVNHWSNLPVIEAMTKQITKMTGQPYNVVSAHFYADGSVEIKKHKDKELRDSIIVSLSFGTTRIMRFERGDKVVDVPLNSGALCFIDPPTNDLWTHSIPTDSSTTHRMSLVFRYQPFPEMCGSI